MIEQMKILLLGKVTYYVNVLDGNSGYCMVRFLSKMNKVTNAVIDMIQKIKNLLKEKFETLSCILR